MQAIRLLIVALCVISSAFAENAPLFLWGANSEAVPALTTINEKKFAELVSAELEEKTLIVFLENGLTNKDFLCTTANDGKSCFARLQGVSGKTFFPSVQNPVEALLSIADNKHEYNSVDTTGKLSKNLEVSKSKIVFVNFDDGSESDSRDTILNFHDFSIERVTSQFGDNVFYMYTTTPSTTVSKSLKRQRRATTDSSTGNVIRDGANLLLYYTTLSVVGDNKEVTNLDLKSFTVDVKNKTAMSVSLVTSASPLTFDITLAGGYFFMKNVVYNNIKFISNEIYAPTDFSYFCGNLTLNSYITTDQPTPYTIKWNSFQFQAPFGHIENSTFVFGDPWHCVGFFTGGILSGLLIVALLLTITFIGVCWMMDINTMDRFDDPKGKTITINVSE